MESSGVLCAIPPGAGLQGWVCWGASGWGGTMVRGQDPALSCMGDNLWDACPLLGEPGPWPGLSLIQSDLGSQQELVGQSLCEAG